jgi:hypothetical protein
MPLPGLFTGSLNLGDSIYETRLTRDSLEGREQQTSTAFIPRVRSRARHSTVAVNLVSFKEAQYFTALWILNTGRCEGFMKMDDVPGSYHLKTLLNEIASKEEDVMWHEELENLLLDIAKAHMWKTGLLNLPADSGKPFGLELGPRGPEDLIQEDITEMA